MIAHQYQGGHPPAFGIPPSAAMHASMMMPPLAHYAPRLGVGAPQHQMRQQHATVPMHPDSASSHEQFGQQRHLKSEYNGYSVQQPPYADAYQQQHHPLEYRASQQGQQRGDNGLGRSWSVYNNSPSVAVGAGQGIPARLSTAAERGCLSSSSSLNEERAHLDRLFSALAATHPHTYHHSALATSYGAGQHHHQQGRNHSRALAHPYAGLRVSSLDQHQYQHQLAPASAQLWGPASQAHHQHDGYSQMDGYRPALQSSLPLPHHQVPALQPAFDFGPAISKGAFDEKAVEASLLPVSAVRYHEAMLEQDRRSLAIQQAHHHRHVQHQEEIAAAAAWADYAIQQQQHQQQNPQNHASLMQLQGIAEDAGMAQMEFAEIVLPGKEITLDDEPELIPKDASAIPPPPSIEKSAYPLAALATDLVWDAFISASSSSSASIPASAGFGPSSAGSGHSPTMPCLSGSQSPMFRTEVEYHSRARSSSPLTGSGIPVPSQLLAANQSFGSYPRTPASVGPRKSHLRSTSKSVSPSCQTSERYSDRTTNSVSKDSTIQSGYATSAGNVYGAIGGERKPSRYTANSKYKQNEQHEQHSPASSSSPASTAPGTPDSNSEMGGDNTCIVKTGSDSSLGAKMNGKRLSASHITGGAISWLAYGDANAAVSDSFSNANKDIYSAALLKNPVQTQRQQQQQQQRIVNQLDPPVALFEQVQKLLGATLLSQQVLLLALYFVAKTPHTCPLYPPATSQSALKSTSAPFKLLLAALVVANKHLDDNSFRNSTFAQVANVTLPEVNALEFSMLSSLEFDINVPSADWLAWLRDMQYQKPTRFSASSALSTGVVEHQSQQQQQPEIVDVAAIVTPIIEGVLAHQEEHARLFNSPITSPDMERFNSLHDDAPYKSSVKTKDTAAKSRASPTTMMFYGEQEPEMDESIPTTCFDMDAAGPLETEQRPRYNKAFGDAVLDSSSSTVDNFHQNGDPVREDEEAMFGTSTDANDLDDTLKYGSQDDWDMPEDPYASRAHF